MPEKQQSEPFKTETGKLRNVDFETALNLTGFGRYNVFLVLVCGLTLYGVNNEAYSIGYILPSAECDLQLDVYTKGILSSANFVGIMGSCCFWGYLSDTRGRRKVLIVTLLLSVLTGAAAALTPSFWGFTILRFCNGIFISGPSAITFAYFGEFQSEKHRSACLGWSSLLIGLAMVALPGFGWLLLPKPIHFEFFGLTINSWRLFMLMNSMPNFAVALAFFKLPESPKYLYHSGDVKRALQVLQKIYAINTGNSEESFPVESFEEKILLEKTTVQRNLFGHLFNQIAPLFRAPYRKYTLVACFLQAGVFAVASGLFLWYPDIINQLIKSEGDKDLSVCTALKVSQGQTNGYGHCESESLDDQIFIQNLIIGATYVASYVMFGIVVNFLGNRNFFAICMAVSAIALLLLNFLTNKTVIDVFFVIVLTVPGTCVIVVNLMITDKIPTHLCGMVVCIVMTSGRFGSIVSSSVVGLMLEWNCSTTFTLYGANLICCLLLSFVFPKSTATTIKEKALNSVI